MYYYIFFDKFQFNNKIKTRNIFTKIGKKQKKKKKKVTPVFISGWVTIMTKLIGPVRFGKSIAALVFKTM